MRLGKIAVSVALGALAVGAQAQSVRVPPVRTIADLGACDTFKLVGITDGTSGATCSSGGGTTDVLCLCADGTWTPIPTSSSSGTVSSVALSVPAEWSVSGSPITTSGTLTISEATQSANTVYAGPNSGGSAAPGFRSLVSADIPNNAANTSGNAGTATALAANGANCSAGSYPLGVDASGAVESCTAVTADHGGLSGLSDDDHSQYTLLAGRGSFQSLTGAVGTTGYLKFNAHSGDGGGSIYFSPAVNTDTGVIRLVYGGSGIYNGAMYAYGKGTYFVTCAGVGGGAGMIGCTDDNDHYVVSRGFIVSTDGAFPGVAIRGAGSTGTGVSNQFVGLQMSSDTKIGWVNATNLTFSPTADLFIDRDRASMFRVSSTTDGTGGATLLIVPTDTAPTCNKKGIQWERSSVDALCRCNGSTWDKLAGADSCP